MTKSCFVPRPLSSVPSSGGSEVSVSHAYMSESYFTIISSSSTLETLITHSDNSREVMAQFTICSYNIHHCYTDDGKHSFDQIVQTIQNLKPDILCLQVIICSQLCRQVETSILLIQECSSHDVRKLQTALDFKHRLTYLDNSLMTNLEVEEVSASKSRPKYVTAKIIIDPSAEPLYVTNCHLHYKTEPIRPPLSSCFTSSGSTLILTMCSSIKKLRKCGNVTMFSILKAKQVITNLSLHHSVLMLMVDDDDVVIKDCSRKNTYHIILEQTTKFLCVTSGTRSSNLLTVITN